MARFESSPLAEYFRGVFPARLYSANPSWPSVPGTGSTSTEWHHITMDKHWLESGFQNEQGKNLHCPAGKMSHGVFWKLSYLGAEIVTCAFVLPSLVTQSSAGKPCQYSTSFSMKATRNSVPWLCKATVTNQISWQSVIYQYGRPPQGHNGIQWFLYLNRG